MQAFFNPLSGFFELTSYIKLTTIKLETIVNMTSVTSVRTRLAPPRIAGATVQREALLQQLQAGRQHKLTLVTSPSGCGKTVLLSQWGTLLNLHGATVAWCHAASGDDGQQIIESIVDSLKEAKIKLPADATQLYVHSDGKTWQPFLTAVLEESSLHAGEVFLIIDNFHLVSSPSLLRLFDRWLESMPDNFHLVLGSHQHPLLKLTQLRVEDQLTELDFNDLHFDLSETRQFVHAQGLSTLNGIQVARLHQVTDGWPASLQLLARFLRKCSHAGAFFDLFEQRSAVPSPLPDGALNDYLEQVVTAHFSPEELDFLTSISLCRRFNSHLCELLTNHAHADTLLQKFAVAKLFLVAVDSVDSVSWYRLHPLLAAFLGRRLQHLQTAQVIELHRLACRWFAERRLFVEALEHAELIGDTALVFELIKHGARDMLHDNCFTQLLTACNQVPTKLLHDHPATNLCVIWAQLCCGQVDEVERDIKRIPEHLDYNHIGIQDEIRLLRIIHGCCKDDTHTGLALLEPLLDAAPPDDAFQMCLLGVAASFILSYAGQFDRARQFLSRQLHHQTANRYPSVKEYLSGLVGITYLLQGRIRNGLKWAELCMRLTERSTTLGSDLAAYAVGYVVEIYYQTNDIDAARALLDQRAELTHTVQALDAQLFCHVARARIQYLDGDSSSALQTLRRLEELGNLGGRDRLIAWSLCEQVRLALAMGQHPTAFDLQCKLEQLAQRYREYTYCAWGEITLAALLAKADLALAQSHVELCLDQIALAELFCHTHGRELLEVRLGFMRAIALLRKANVREALELTRKLALHASEHEMNRVLADLGPVAKPLIAMTLATNLTKIERDYLEASLKVLQELPADRLEPHYASGPRLTSATRVANDGGILSSRETEVLSLLSKALTMKGIGRALGVSDGTIKWHLQNIYGKLAVNSRQGALAKARNLGMLE
ncbi:LuxR C-terminal-related transcriptional regulator [Paraburkholderia metrosideri]|uniref:LuxR C-terminal-related transcriptional regulator n=1 Tax=Paraburkholderia metrosideri TaxID=580937 RepID=A0ABW9E187_9BURK